MKVKVGDNVVILAGKDKGKEGRIIKTLKKENKVVVEGINMIKKHIKPNRMNEVGSIQEMEAPIHISNVKKIENKKETKKEAKTSSKKVTATKTTKVAETKATKAVAKKTKTSKKKAS